MGTIAKGEITLSPVNDAYTVLLTPSSCSISADFDGSNPNLTNAKGTITVKRGTKIVPFKVRQVVYSSAGISVSWPFQEVTTLSFAMTKLANTILDGYVKFQITTQDGFNYTTEVQFSFNVVRESTMLDWIQDWEGSKTKVGGTYIMTPKLFVGKKEAVLDTSGTQPTWKEGALTGVYIGPDLLASGESSNGIYGYLKSQEIFHLNGDGGMIGGWSIDSYGISSKEGRLQILSNGVIRAINAEGDAIWSIGENGEASFAMENVRFYANGDAEFKGKITSQEGSIGGWTIEEGRIYNIPIGISAARKYIAIANVSKLEPDSEWGDDHWGWMRGYGGAALYYSSSNNFGFVAYGTGGDNLVFSAGSTNCIAGWNFDTEAIWSGDKNNTIKGYATNGITIGSNGLRGIKWYIDANGDVSFMGGKITFSAADNGGEIVGWKLNESRFSTDKITLVSDDANTGLYMSAAANSQFNSRSAASLENFIDSDGGIYLKIKADSADLAAYDLNGKRIFKIKSNGVSHIAGWNFDHATLYTGTAAISGYTNTGEITLGPTGLRGYKWRFENDGSGALAGGKINWDADGNLNVDAKISANNITAGTISTASIQCEGKWALNIDGSGYLANQNVIWDADGNINVKGSFSQDMHYAYKCDATIIARRETGIEDEIELQLNNHLYLATNVLDFSDNDLYISENWPYPLYPKQYYIIRLPLNRQFIGKEVKIYDCNYGPFTRQPMGWCTTTIKSENDETFITKVSYEADFYTRNEWKSITIRGGYASFVCIPDLISSKGCRWICVDFYGALCEGVDANNNLHQNLL